MISRTRITYTLSYSHVHCTRVHLFVGAEPFGTQRSNTNHRPIFGEGLCSPGHVSTFAKPATCAAPRTPSPVTNATTPFRSHRTKRVHVSASARWTRPLKVGRRGPRTHNVSPTIIYLCDRWPITLSRQVEWASHRHWRAGRSGCRRPRCARVRAPLSAPAAGAVDRARQTQNWGEALPKFCDRFGAHFGQGCAESGRGHWGRSA